MRIPEKQVDRLARGAPGAIRARERVQQILCLTVDPRAESFPA